jgi:sigma-B regulation protein RsbQ
VAPADAHVRGPLSHLLYDLVGSGGSDLSAYNPKKYSSLQGHAQDLLEVAREFSQGPCIFVGHSVSAMIGSLLDTLDSNYLGWASAMAPTIMGAPDRPDLQQELTNSFCQTDPEIAKHFARVTFLGDNRLDLPKLTVPSLILQCSDDIIAPCEVGEYMHRACRPRRFLAKG